MVNQHRKSWAGNLLAWSDLTLGPSFKVKRGQPNLKALITRLLLVLEVWHDKPAYNNDFWRNPYHSPASPCVNKGRGWDQFKYKPKQPYQQHFHLKSQCGSSGGQPHRDSNSGDRSSSSQFKLHHRDKSSRSDQ